VWFWPGDWLDSEYIPTPENFYNPSEKLLARVRLIAQEQRFFHWELEFPEVFVTGKGGFDAIVGNPPWETLQPVSKEFFTKYDPIFRTYGKFRKNESIEREWLLYNSGFKSMGNLMQYNAFPWGDPEEGNRSNKSISFEKGKGGKLLHERWRRQRSIRKGFSDPDHPFQLQGEGKAYTYKLFLEQSKSLLRNNGRMGLIVPSGIYTDKGTTEMRTYFLNKCSWEWLFGFENRKKIFDIDSRFKFCPIIIEKGSTTSSIKAAFMRHDLSDWENPFDKVLDYTRSQVTKFSPNSKAILEIRAKRDLEILEKIYSNSVLLGDQSPDGWQIKYAQGDFNMTSDSHLFPPRSWWEEKGYKPDQYGRWLPPKGEKPKLIYKGKEIGPPGDIGLPLYEGKMIWQYDFSFSSYESGQGTRSKWVINSPINKIICSQYIMPQYNHYLEHSNMKGIKIIIRDISNATNVRTIVSTVINDFPSGHNAPILNLTTWKAYKQLLLISILNSFSLDYITRLKMGGLHLTWHLLEELPLLSPNFNSKYIEIFTCKIACNSHNHSFMWILLSNKYSLLKNSHLKKLWAFSSHERLRIRCIIDSLVAKYYNFNYYDMKYIIKTDLTDPKGFWRVDKDKPQELRQTTLTLVAFRDLEKMIEENGGDVEKGIQAFCEQNDGEGWMIPEKIRFIQREDGTLDFDTPDSVEYEVRSKLGPRFYDWQLKGTPEESWKECEMHARNILGDEEFEKFIQELDKEEPDMEKHVHVGDKTVQIKQSSLTEY